LSRSTGAVDVSATPSASVVSVNVCPPSEKVTVAPAIGAPVSVSFRVAFAPTGSLYWPFDAPV